MKAASWKDIQLCARTKLPVDAAQVISDLASEQNVSEYVMIRRLLYTGMWWAYHHNEWCKKAHGYKVMTEETASKLYAICKARMKEGSIERIKAESEVPW